MRLNEAIQKILQKYDDGNTFFIATDGMISRELWNQKKENVFPMVGSMGLAPAIGVGLALNIKNRIVVLNGDGSFLMSKGTQDIINTYKPKNLVHIILNNNGYGTTGGQKRAMILRNKKDFNLKIISFENSKEMPPRIENLFEVANNFRKDVFNLINKNKGE